MVLKSIYFSVACSVGSCVRYYTACIDVPSHVLCVAQKSHNLSKLNKDNACVYILRGLSFPCVSGEESFLAVPSITFYIAFLQVIE